jgi:DNA-directed RNA polymerase subunit K/omega
LSAGAGVTSEARRGPITEQTMGNRFLLCAIAFHRTKQLKDGAAPRLADTRHKPGHLAVLEVMADTISWTRV